MSWPRSWWTWSTAIQQWPVSATSKDRGADYRRQMARAAAPASAYLARALESFLPRTAESPDELLRGKPADAAIRETGALT